MDVTIYSQTGQQVEKMPLPKEIFEAKINENLMHRALMMQLGNARQPIAHTKTRSEREGSTKKITRQKGLGQARQGTIRSPVHRKGGVAWGPRNTRNFETKMTKQERRAALFSALSGRASEQAITGLDKYEGGMSTKKFQEMLEKLSLQKKVLVVLPEKNATLEKSSGNLQNVKTILVNYLNVRDVLQYQNLLFLKDAIAKLPSIFLK